ncbi:MAG: AAA family ATPase, partial [Planctomycetes bacterium]|nr:AAA family ATPase [Planctomycetota bacterium]
APVDAPGACAVLEQLRGKAAGDVDVAALQGFARVLQPADVGGPALPSPTQQDALQELERALFREGSRSLLLVGEAGAGKTTVAHQLVAQLLANGWVVFTASAAQLLAGQSFVGQLEQRVQELVRAAGKRPKVLWLVPDFAEFVGAGRTIYSRAGMLDLLLPHLVAGDLRVLAPLSPAAWEQLLREMPALRTAAATVRLPECPADETLALGRAWLRQRQGTGPLLCDDALLVELYQRSQQHLAHEARPGGLLRLLGQLREHVLANGPARAATLDDAIALLSRLSGLPAAVLDDRDGLDLSRLRAAFTARVMGQPEAVDCLVERVAMLKAGLNDPKRPIGVFLFTGPTGTGKTELCRALAEYLFGSEQRMLRLDMSEFQHPESLGRLLGDADAVHGRKALVHQIREQPFAVVLLDEIEKAHPMVFDLFLQVFDEGRLTDRQGRVADFRHAIVIATSNLGLRTLEGAGLGFGDRAPDLQKALEEVFRREFLNRIDRVVVFRSLDPDTLRQVLHKELDLVLQRRGLRQRPWAVEWDESALQFLLAQGYTPTLGARPLRRAIERHVLAPLAAAIVSDRTPAGDQFLFVRSDGRSVQVEFVDPDGPPAQAPAPVVAVVASLGTLAREAEGRLEEVAAVQREPVELQGHLDEPAWAERKAAAYAAMGGADFWTSSRRHEVLGSAELMSRIEDAVGHAAERAAEFAGRGREVAAEPLRRLAARALLLQLSVGALERGEAQDAYVLVAPVHDPHGDAAATAAFARELVGMYRAWAERRGMEWRVLEDGGGATLVAIAGFAAWPVLAPDAGLHVLEAEDERSRPGRVRVTVVAQPSTPASGAAEVALARQCLGPVQSQTPAIVRRYRRGPSPEVRDRVRGWRTGKWARVLGGEFDVMG